jgi:two-component sensor histidine kinase
LLPTVVRCAATAALRNITKWRFDRILLPDGRPAWSHFSDTHSEPSHTAASFDELNHRVKNTLVSVQAIEQQTFCAAQRPDGLLALRAASTLARAVRC